MNRVSYSKLRGKIREVFGTQEAFAVALGINAATISGKLNGEALHIPMEEMHVYFFTPKIAKTQR